MKSKLAVARSLAMGVFLLLTTAAHGPAQDTGDEQAIQAMTAFLDAWLEQGNAEAAQAFFSRSTQATALAPKAVWPDGQDPSTLPGDYLALINDIWEPETPWRTGWDGPTLMDGPGAVAIQIFEEELEVEVISNEDDALLVYEATNEVSIETFNSGYSDVAPTLLGNGRRTLGMIAEIATKTYAGPFIAFWELENDDEWRIQAIGAIGH